MRLAPRKVRLARRLLSAALLALVAGAGAATEAAPPAAKVSSPEDYAGRLRAVAAPLRKLGELCELI